MHVSSTTTSPSNSLSKGLPASKQKPKLRKRSNPFGAKAAKDGVVGTEKEKKRTQTIADSLDLGGDLQIVEDKGGSRVVGDGDGTLGRRKTVADGLDLGGDLQTDEEKGGSRVVGEGDHTLARRKTVAVEIGLGPAP